MGRFHRHDTARRIPTTTTTLPTTVTSTRSATTPPTPPGPERVTVLERIFTENDRAAEANRRAFAEAERRLRQRDVVARGREDDACWRRRSRTCASEGYAPSVVEGDIETSIDADRLRGLAHQISLLNTGNGFGGECHLDAPMVARALERLDLDDLDVVLVENVGNLVCPAEFDVGAHRRVMVCSVTEGEDKPLKYPVMFRSVDAVLVNKTDLLPHLDLDVDLLERNIRAVNPSTQILRMSARTGAGLDDWYAWLTGALSG